MKIFIRSLVTFAAGLGMFLAWKIGSVGELRWHENQRRLSRQRDAILALSPLDGKASKSESTELPAIPADSRRGELVSLRAESIRLEDAMERLKAKLATQSGGIKGAMPPAEFIPFGVPAASGARSNHDDKLYRAELEKAAFRRSDARRLSSALRRFSRANEGNFPGSFLEVLTSLDESDSPREIGAFDLLFQGNTEDLGVIPLNAVALIREREPWRSPSGKMARIYGMLGGFIRIVESDDDFVAWERAHVVPLVSK